MSDVSSRPRRRSQHLPMRRERRIVKVRFTQCWGAPRIAAHLEIAYSTVEAALRRYRMPLLRHLDQNTGLPVRGPKPCRYEYPVPRCMIHVDIKRLGRIADSGGHRKLGRPVGNRNNKKQGRGYADLHRAVNDHCRLTYSEILGNERKSTAAGVWTPANAFFNAHGIVVFRVLTDNGSCYRSNDFANILTKAITRKFTRPAGLKPLGKSSGSTAPRPPTGPTPTPTRATEPAQRPMMTGYTNTTTTEPTPASAASPIECLRVDSLAGNYSICSRGRDER
jgi:hypothetical protein